MKSSSIQVGDDVTWLINSEYTSDFRVLRMYPSSTLKDDFNEPVMMTLLRPHDEKQFATVVLEVEIDIDELPMKVEVPLALLVPITHRTLH